MFDRVVIGGECVGLKRFRKITVDEALHMLDEQLIDVGYMKIQGISLKEFITGDEMESFVLSGSLGRGFRLRKIKDEFGITFEYTQYPEYSTNQSFVWILNRNAEWSKYRIIVEKGEI